MARFIPSMLLGLTSLGLLIGGVSPAWWITGLVAAGLAFATLVGTSISIAGRNLHLAPYLPAIFVGLAALGLLAAGAGPAWWVTGLVALGLAITTWFGTSSSIAGRSLHLAPFLPSIFVGLAAVGLLAAGASPAWWITALVAVGLGLVQFMATYSEAR